MDDEEEIVRELRKLESLDDDLYLGDVDASWAGAGRGSAKSKRGRAARGGGIRGASHGRPSRNQGRLSDGDIDRNDLNNFDNWDLEQEEGDTEKHREGDSSFDSRRGGYRGRSRPFEKREAANAGHKSFGRGKPVHDKTRFDDYKMSDTFDIESNQQRGDNKHLDRGWSRDSRDGVNSGRAQAYDEADIKIDEKGGFIMHRKDPRLTGRQLDNETRSSPKISDSRIPDGTSSSETHSQRKDLRLSGHTQPTSRGKDPKSELLYDNLMKDPRLMAQQVEKLRKEKEAVERDIAEREKALAQAKSDSRMSSKSSEHPRGFENRFMPVRIDARPQAVDYNKAPTEKTIFEKISNNPVLQVNQIPGIGKDLLSPDAPIENVRRGPRSPSPVRSVSPTGKKVRNGSPSSRKRERSPVKNRSSRWERSTSPSRGRRDRSPSPRRRSSRKERSNSGDRRNERSHDRRDWSGSPRRERSRRERSPSPRRRHRSRSRSSSRDRSLSSRRSPPSARQQHQRDISAEAVAPNPGPPPLQTTRYPPPPQSGYDMPPPNMYSDQYQQQQQQQQPPNYGGLPPGLPYAPYQQQQYQQYDNYGYPQQPYGDYQQQQHQPPPQQQAPPPPMGAWGNDRPMMYPDMSQPPPPAAQAPPAVAPPPPTPAPPVAPPPPKVDVKAEEAKKEAAIKNEKLQQKQTLTKQREEYIRKSSMISRELQLLKNQEEELREENSRDNERILRENNKLQLEITNKLKAINNVIDMLTGIIGDKKELEEKKRAKIEKTEKKHPKTPPDTPPKSSSSSGSSPTLSSHANGPEPPVPGESLEPLPPPPPPIKTTPVPPPTAVPPPSALSDDNKPQFNYVHYDPEMHWCRVCDVFPRTAKEFLNHLHSSEHKEETLERKMVDMPWHKVPNMEMEVPHHKGAPTKRTPIRGLQFFISATAWYCKLCDVWIGDLHCASLHLKSKTHTENYVNFTVQSPHWETDWLADREKAYERKADERRQLRDTAPDLATTGVSPSNVKPLLKDLIKDEKTVKKNKKDRKKERRAKDEKEGKKKKRRKKGKKKAKNSSGSDSSSSSSSDNSSDEDSDIESDKGKSIRVAMRNKMKAMENEQLIKELPASYLRPTGGWQTLDSKEEAERSAREQVEQEERVGRELREKYLKEVAEQQLERERIEHERYERMVIEKEEREGKFRKVPQKEDKMLREWMSANKELPDGEKQILSNIKDRMKLRQEAEKERKYDQRDRYYENRYYDDRRKRRGDSPDGRMGKRGRSRSPEERRWDKNRGGDRSQGKYNKRSPPRPKVESRFQDVREEPAERKNSGDKKQVTKRVDVVEQDEAETKFERQAAEAAARLKKKDKKPTVAAIPKSKLPFIGRMPIMKHLAKKKGEDENMEMKSKVADVPANRTMIGPALPPSMLAMQALIQPPLPEKGRPEDLGAGAVVQDMDIDDEDSNPGEPSVVEEQVPVTTFDELIPIKQPPLPEVKKVVIPDILPEEETSIIDDVMDSKETAPSKKPVNDIPLPKDFQEALNILFPGQTKAGEEPPKQETPTPPPPLNNNSQWNQDVISTGGPHPLPGFNHGPMMGMQGMHPMYQQGGMMPQGMNGPPGFQMPMQGMMSREMQGPPLPSGDRPRNERMPQRKVKADSDSSSDEDGGQDKFKSEMSEDDLAMLGIDAGDMAAQSF